MNPDVTVKYLGRQDGSPSSALTVRAGDETEVLELGKPKSASRAIAERCDELRETFKFEVHGLGGSGSSSSSRSTATASGSGSSAGGES